MMTDADRKKAADSLLLAEKERKPVVQLSRTWPDIAIEDSYAIQGLVNAAKVAGGTKVIADFGSLGSLSVQFV
jgi:2-oxo-hept-3-ene-1,7-dioate hydratase